MRRGGLGGLRLASGGIGRGIGWGVLGLFVIEPLIFWSGMLTEWIYQKWGIEHPMAHEMLNILGSSHSPALQILIVVTAVILAPVFEEILFRGLLQTLISQGRTASPAAPPPLPIPVDVPAGDGPPVLEYARPAAALIRPIAGRAWLAILISALLFAAVHEPWTMPPIFVLAVCLGYAYERTGNLWTCITMHALFNLVSVLQYRWLMMH
jgi:membrane protease YdiL (CAAX protease family)